MSDQETYTIADDDVTSPKFMTLGLAQGTPASDAEIGKIRNYSLSLASKYTTQKVNYASRDNANFFEVTGNFLGTPAQAIDFAISGNIPYLVINSSGSQADGFDQSASSTFTTSPYTITMF